ncbi:hypothetical protein [Glaciimonas soli]|uniref:Uncharacterized protein n=1 Tax=Glaciimonas soli TaxID=2590999 RepID=A0A843YSX8_9BURK|nr:hypothetical protein [Glaciimonas soli]MQR00608.1 hypothetical protein [Glaciimonas soli]
MDLVKVKLDRVFDIVKIQGRSGRHTLFSFESSGVKHYGISVRDWPKIESGMVISALLERDEDWQSIFGWVDHSTGEVFNSEGYTAVFVCILLLFLSVVSAGAFLADWRGNWFALLISLGLIYYAIVNVTRALRAKKILGEFAATLK